MLKHVTNEKVHALIFESTPKSGHGQFYKISCY